MPSGGYRIGAGRPKGSINLKSIELITNASNAGMTPMEYMLDVMRDENASKKERAWAAEKAAPYIHARPAPIQQKINIELPAIETCKDVPIVIAAIMRAVSNGEISPSEGKNLCGIADQYRKAIETDELIQRIEALEKGIAE